MSCSLYLMIPARRRLRCQSRATSSSACLPVFWPSKVWETPARSDSSSPSHAGLDEIGIPVSIASAAAAGQPSLATIAGLRNDDPRGGALPPSMERSIASLHEFHRPVGILGIFRYRHKLAVDNASALRLLGKS